MQVMYGVELRAEHFLTLVEVIEVSATEVMAGISIALAVQRAGIFPITGITNFDHASTGK